jgi:hypothetical protein
MPSDNAQRSREGVGIHESSWSVSPSGPAFATIRPAWALPADDRFARTRASCQRRQDRRRASQIVRLLPSTAPSAPSVQESRGEGSFRVRAIARPPLPLDRNLDEVYMRIRYTS